VIVTNNLQTVFASFYPKSWDVKRYPMASLAELLKIHAARIGKKKTVKIDASNTWEMINNENHRIELENCEAGFCEKLEDKNHVTLTFFGRYRLWRDMLFFTYLGKGI
jgi:hypothetical protein